MTPGKLETIFPMTLATSLIDGDEHCSSSVQDLCNPIAFSLVSCIVIVTEFVTNPRVVRTCVGMRMDFSGCTTKPKLSNKTMVYNILDTLLTSLPLQVKVIEMCHSNVLLLVQSR